MSSSASLPRGRLEHDEQHQQAAGQDRSQPHSQAAFLVYLGEAQQHPTLSAYATALKDAPESDYPLDRLTHQVEAAVRTARRGQHPELVYQAVRWAVQEVVFLYFVHSEAKTRLIADWRALCLQLALAVMKRRLWPEDA